MAYRIGAKESVGYYATWTLGPSMRMDYAPITDWVFALRFERWAEDPAGFLLGMAASDAAQGFRIVDVDARRISCRILPTTLASIADTTARFEMMGDLLATPPGVSRFFVADFCLTVLRGPTA